MSIDYPEHLRIQGRNRLSTKDFRPFGRLFRCFEKEDLDDFGCIKVETIKFPDFSCNWDRYSKPEDIRYRLNGRKSDGCYSITVDISRYRKIATPVHDPIYDPPYENYAHVEVRVLKENEDIYSEPEKGRKLYSKRKKLEYRQNIVNSSIIELHAE